MKILYLVTKDDVGGAQKYVRDLAEEFTKSGHETKIITGGNKGVRFLSNKLRPHFLFANDWLALAELFFLLKKERPDIVHLNSSKAGVIGAVAAKLAGVKKVIFTAHGWVFNPDNDLNFAKRKLYILLHKIAARFQDKIINVSEYDKKLAIRHQVGEEKKLITVYNGLDWKNLRFLDRRTARKTIATLSQSGSDQGIWIGSIGRLVSEKSYHDFINAAALVKNPEAKFFIIGDGYLKDRLTKVIKKRGLENRFFILPGLAPAAPYLKAFDIFLLSSIKEGLPYTLLEAMAAGVPVITTRVGGMPEIVDGRGLVMQPQQPDELARAIDFYLKNKEKAQYFAKEGQLFLKEQLNLAKMVEQTKTAYLS
ncbi:MAG: group 1 glycosyl transferase [Parcubacteria group bacterium Gr01-1014_19]|nr:MAG: group 1 glycosyl transferase [Parcubacteria group bacterium Gr01-1014_19]